MSRVRILGRPWMRRENMYPWRQMDNEEKRARWAAVWYGDHPKNCHPWKWLREEVKEKEKQDG